MKIQNDRSSIWRLSPSFIYQHANPLNIILTKQFDQIKNFPLEMGIARHRKSLEFHLILCILCFIQPEAEVTFLVRSENSSAKLRNG